MLSDDEEVLALWKRFRDFSITKYQDVYARLNIRFSVYAGESFVQPKSITQAMDTLRSMNLLTTKTVEESNPDWSAKKAAMKQQPEPSDSRTEDVVDNPPVDGTRMPAYAVDLTKWKLEKPVVQKPGICVVT
jgi:arginyl-tRNA synthetase